MIRFKLTLALVAALGVASVVAAGSSARVLRGPATLDAKPAHGFVPARHAKSQAGTRHVSLLTWHSGPVMHSTSVVPVFWGSRWASSTFKGDKVSGLDTVYAHVGGTAYARTNGEYTDGAGSVNTTSISKGTDVTDTSATPTGAPSTSQVLQEVAKVTGNRPVANAYYPVYSDQPRGNAGYCAWHSSGTIAGVRVQFGFFFNLDGDPGCDPQSPSSLGHSQGLAALANVSGHELSEMVTDPQLNAWYDQKGAENSDKCAWTFNGTVAIGGQSWKIQGNWSNAAADTNSGYANVGCIQTR
ncbi:MAG: hypothetical protein QOG06_2288 [Gaiellaceae bacterium]|jgi:hypothetical protein|nr:hypothetical protein [Gaiellaceae bacterium]